MPNVTGGPWIQVPPGTPQKRCKACGTLVYVLPDLMRNGSPVLVVCGIQRGIHPAHGIEQRHPDATVAEHGEPGLGFSHYKTCPDAHV